MYVLFDTTCYTQAKYNEHLVTQCVHIFMVVKRMKYPSISYAAKTQEATKPYDSSSYPCQVGTAPLYMYLIQTEWKGCLRLQ